MIEPVTQIETPKGSVRMRPGRDIDGEALARLIADAFAEYEGCLFDRAREFPELDAPATAFRAIGGTLLVCEHEGRLIGSAAMAPAPQPAIMEMKKVYLEESWRGVGLADRMVTAVLDAARARGAHRVELWTDTRFRAAHRFYRRIGFRWTGWCRGIDDISETFEFHFARPVGRLTPPAE